VQLEGVMAARLKMIKPEETDAEARKSRQYGHSPCTDPS
jgi:hypothetical protein